MNALDNAATSVALAINPGVKTISPALILLARLAITAVVAWCKNRHAVDVQRIARANSRRTRLGVWCAIRKVIPAGERKAMVDALIKRAASAAPTAIIDVWDAVDKKRARA